MMKIVSIMSGTAKFSFIPTHKPGTKTVKIADVLKVSHIYSICPENLHQYILNVMEQVKAWPITEDEDKFNNEQAILYKRGNYFVKADDVLTILDFQDRYSKNCICRTLQILKIANFRRCVNENGSVEYRCMQLCPSYLGREEVKKMKRRLEKEEKEKRQQNKEKTSQAYKARKNDVE